MKKLSIILGLALVTQACIKEDRFGLSSRKDILSFEVTGQAGATTIDADSLVVTVPVDASFGVRSVAPSAITLSNMASITPGIGDTLDFSNPQTYLVTAEDGSEVNWTVILKRQGPEVQLPNSDFN